EGTDYFRVPKWPRLELAAKRATVTRKDMVELGDRSARAARMRPDRADDGEKIGAGFDKGPAILLRDAADRTALDNRRLTPVAQQFGVGVVLGGLGHAWEEGAKGDVVGAGFGGGDRAVPAGAAGHADDAVGAQQAPGLGIGRVFLADMRAVAVEFGG